MSINAFFELLIKANIALFMMGAVYWFLLRKETFHRLNRWVLLGILCGALALPFAQIPDFGLSLHLPAIAETQAASPAADAPVATPGPATAMDFEATAPEIYTTPAARKPDMEWTVLFLAVYGIVAGLLSFRFLFRIFSVFKLISDSDRQNSAVYFNTRVSSPFSFFHYIVLNPKQYAGQLRDQIIAHESVHARQWHTIDILLAEVITVLCWFNPMVWIIKNAIRLNLEFIADEQVLRSGLDKKEYQYNLLKSIVPDYQYILANHFNHTYLKNRIVMMNSKKSPAQSKWKYLLILPALLGLMVAFSPATGQSTVIEKPAPAAAPTPEAIPKTADPAATVAEPGAVVSPAAAVSSGALNAGAVAPAAAVGTGWSSSTVTAAGINTRSSANSNVHVAGSGGNINVSGTTAAAPTSGASVARSGYAYLSASSADVSITSNATPLQGENIYVVITANTSREDVSKIEEELKKKGLYLKFKNLEYDAEGRITRVKVEVSDDHGLSGNLSNTYATPEDKIYLYRFYDGDGGFGIGAGSEIKNEDELPEKVVKAIRETRSGYRIGVF